MGMYLFTYLGRHASVCIDCQYGPTLLDAACKFYRAFPHARRVVARPVE